MRPVRENLFDELKRYVRFGPTDEEALRALLPGATPHFRRIAADFYGRLAEHEDARSVFSGPEQVERLKGTLHEWLRLLLAGPWDHAYYELRARIGRMHVLVMLPQRYMFGAMNLIRLDLTEVAETVLRDDAVARQRTILALDKIVDLELAIMLESYRVAFVEQVQHAERREKAALAQQLALSEARYEEVVEKGEALIVTTDGGDRILLFNRRCEELTGVPRAQAAGRSFLDLFVGARDRPLLEEARGQVLAGQRVPSYEGLVQVVRGDAPAIKVRWHFTTLPAASAPILCAIGIDVTEEHELAVRTRRAERLASLGTMAAGLAHEIRNPLNAAQLQLTLAQRRLVRPTGPDVAGAIGAASLVRGELVRLARIVEEFLHFAGPQPLRLAPGDLRATAEAVVALMAPEAAAASVDLTLQSGSAVPAEIDDERLKQVLLNLVRNAVEAVGPGGHVRLAATLDEEGAALEVSDDGPGLPSGDPPIFEPFYTTKPGGTGLGLAIVHRIVNDHAGKVSVESQPGRTVFRILLPRLLGSAQTLRPIVG